MSGEWWLKTIGIHEFYPECLQARMPILKYGYDVWNFMEKQGMRKGVKG
jgi:hypothetical protein